MCIIEEGINAAVADAEIVRIVIYHSGVEEAKVGQITAIFPVTRELKLLTASGKVNIPLEKIMMIERISKE
ncbi:MAG: hypothetical protein ACYC2T_08600 [Bacillota bacterium]